MAKLNVYSCKEEHDSCHNTEKYRLCGQNLGLNGNYPEYESVQDSVRGYVTSFYNEVNDIAELDINKCCGTAKPGKPGIAHFTQLVQDKAISVGCAFVGYTDATIKPPTAFKIVLGACNYAFGNLVDEQIYEAGPVASGCTTGTNPKYSALCSVDEPVNPNDYLKKYD